MWPRGGMVTQRIANPFIPVRFWAWPPDKNTMDKEILKIALNTQNLSYLNNHTHFAKVKNATCGDEIKVYLKIKNGVVDNFKYEGESCIYCQASASLLSKEIKDKNVNKINSFLNELYNFFKEGKISSDKKWKIFSKIINKKNINRKQCLLLPIKATLKALKF